jgi:hypothetical protein
VTVARGGRDIDVRGDFTVVIGPDDLEVTDAPQQRTAGDGDTVIEIVLPSLVFRAGETISGSVVLTPRKDMSDAELAIYWCWNRSSHPLVRTPAAGGGGKSGQTIKLGKGIPLRDGTPVTLPFEVPLPGDAPPTGEAVHSSLTWHLEASMMYSKWTQGIEKVRRQIVVVNAP